MSAEVLKFREDAADNDQIQMIDIGRILPNPLNPRGEFTDDEVLELSASIRENGLLQPLLLTPYRAAYYIVAGHRRRRACQLAGLIKLPCLIREYSEEQQLDLMLIENIQRRALKPMQEAIAFRRQMTTGKNASVAELVRRIGVSEPYINQRLAILKLSAPVQRMFDDELLPVGAAPILALIHDPGRQKAMAIKAIHGQIPLKKLDTMVRDLEGTPKRTEKPRGPHTSRKKILGDYEVFTRSEAVRELTRDGVVAFKDIAAAFDDICEGTCYQEDGNTEMCESCPAPRMIASLLRRTGIEIKGKQTK